MNLEIGRVNMKTFYVSATLLQTIEAENEDQAYERFVEYLGEFPPKVDDFNDIEIEEANINEL